MCFPPDDRPWPLLRDQSQDVPFSPIISFIGAASLLQTTHLKFKEGHLASKPTTRDFIFGVIQLCPFDWLYCEPYNARKLELTTHDQTDGLR